MRLPALSLDARVTRSTPRRRYRPNPCREVWGRRGGGRVVSAAGTTGRLLGDHVAGNRGLCNLSLVPRLYAFSVQACPGAEHREGWQSIAAPHLGRGAAAASCDCSRDMSEDRAPSRPALHLALALVPTPPSRGSWLPSQARDTARAGYQTHRKALHYRPVCAQHRPTSPYRGPGCVFPSPRQHGSLNPHPVPHSACFPASRL